MLYSYELLQSAVTMLCSVISIIQSSLKGSQQVIQSHSGVGKVYIKSDQSILNPKGNKTAFSVQFLMKERFQRFFRSQFLSQYADF